MASSVHGLPKIMNALQRQRAESVVKAHIRWFQDLRTAVEGGQSDLAPAIIEVDTECEFGKWVCSELPALCSADLVEQIRRTHRDFHRTAAAIVTLALNGRQSEARARLGGNSDLGELSRRLIQKVEELR